MDEFPVKAVFAGKLEDTNALVIILAEMPDGSGRRVELQRALSFDEQDRKTGMNTYCVCTDSGATHYGGVQRYSLDDNLLTIRLSGEAAAELEVEDGFVLTLDAPKSALASLRSALPRVLAEVSQAGSTRRRSRAPRRKTVMRPAKRLRKPNHSNRV
jgi:hypothetical protein